MKELLRFSCLLFFLLSGNVFALPQYYPDSFNNDFAQGILQNEELKNRLHQILSKIHQVNKLSSDTLVESCQEYSKCYQQKKNISYKKARMYLFGQLHLEVDDNQFRLQDKYCQKNYSNKHGLGKMKIPNHRFINCEHTWPQSKFNPKQSKSLQKTDLHHLYPVNSRSNSSRGNSIFAEVQGHVINDKCLTSRRGKSIKGNIRAFEPPDSHKGNVARALFYFSVRYKLTIGEIEESYLRSWHKLDPVDQKEKDRNEAIMKIQGSRNPFIDMADLVGQINDF